MMNRASKSPKSRQVKSIRTMFRILDQLQEGDGARITDVSETLNLAKSSVHQHLNTLNELGYVVKEGEKYYVGLGFLQLSEYARQRKKEYRIAKPMVQELAEESGERAQFFVEELGRAIYLHTVHGKHAVRADRSVGTRRYMHSSSGGKAILAHYSGQRIDEIIDRWGLPAETENTITTREELLAEMETVRQQGYSVNREESIPGLRAIGVPIKHPDGGVLGSFSISGPTHRLQGEGVKRSLIDLLLGKANEFELKLAYS